MANQVRLWLFILAHNLGNLMRRLTLPEGMQHWTLTSLQIQGNRVKSLVSGIIRTTTVLYRASFRRKPEPRNVGFPAAFGIATSGAPRFRPAPE